MTSKEEQVDNLEDKLGELLNIRIEEAANKIVLKTEENKGEDPEISAKKAKKGKEAKKAARKERREKREKAIRSKRV